MPPDMPPRAMSPLTPNPIFSQKVPLVKTAPKPMPEQFDQLKLGKPDGKTFEDSVKMLTNTIVDMLRGKDSNKEKIDNLLQGEDDCVAWLILCNALDSKSKDREESAEARIKLCDSILEKKAYIAFDDASSFKKTCVDRKVHWFYPLAEKPPVPFWKAAEMCNARVMSSMVSHAKVFCQEFVTRREGKRPSILTPEKARTTDPDKLLQDLVWTPWKEFKTDTGKTALKLAALSHDAETVEVLLNVHGISDTQDNTFEWALDEAEEEIVEKFLQAECAKHFVTSKYLIRAMNNLVKATTSHPRDQGIADSSPEDMEIRDKEIRKLKTILLSLVKLATTPEVVKNEIAEAMIKHDLEETWKDRPPEWDKLLVTDSLVHLAVLHQKPRFVKDFLKDYSGSVLHPAALRKHLGDQEEHYPLWYNNRQWDENSSKFVKREVRGSKNIRNAIVRSTIRQEKDMQELMKIFQTSGEPVRELFFDISGFNSKTIRISEFIESLIQHHDPKKLLLPLYEPTIRYAEFPALDLKVDDRENVSHNNHFTVQHREVFDALSWLRNHKEVESIIELKVQDRLVNPHSELGIAEFVDLFNVEVLDWKILDLSISIFNQESKKRITELHLYSSGKRAVISHWLGNEGLKTLTKLSTLTISIVKETMTAGDCEETHKDIQTKLTNFMKDSECPWTKKPEFEVKTRFWNSAPGQVNLDEIAQRLAPKLAVFLDNLKGLFRNPTFNRGNFRRTKVAIIDNGILGITPRASYHKPGDTNGEHQAGDERNLLSRVRDGCSFVDDHSKLGSWLFASDPHGTQMANLICAIDPLCDLYVAKVTEDKSGITKERVTRAVAWAISQEVDIISMSFALLETTKELGDQIELANTKGIVMVCSTHDEGERIKEAWPASYQYQCKKVITACDEYGRQLRENSLPTADYRLQGKNVWAGDIPFLDSRESPTGSSVSTALAAGLSSLILTCDRLANPNSDLLNTARHIRVEEFLKEMKSSAENSNFVILEKFGGIHMNRGKDSAFTILQDTFHQPRNRAIQPPPHLEILLTNGNGR